ncbi:uncharacterized protein TRIREDRAFT_106604 [Trichoderma reesei QM6a]|uniref:Predicted protein n=1 Tax=Hypocrea jecorina (strain QM6a) TaxID=431241 RepID=G0RGV5_HYPJQ|nr:uncharacterized protein TRIREDRAFT_106604 [Trichoderma reesei QM6a]EGR49637.1 predicted protein [Trichoderma reesei QM6a]
MKKRIKNQQLVMEEEKEVSPVWFAIAVTMAVFFLFNVLMAIIWVLLPDDLCFPPFSAHQAALRAARYHNRPQAYAYTAQSYYSLRSVYVDGSRSRQVTVFNGYVETDEDFDAWAYWATDSEETLGNSAFGRLQSQSQSLRSGQTQGQFQYYRQHDLHSNAGTAVTGSAASSTRGLGYHRNERAQLPSPASTLTGARGHAARLALGIRPEYNPEPRMEASPDGAPPRYSQLPREVHCSLHPRVYPYPQTPPPVRTWGHGSAATIRPVVENHRRETGASQDKVYVKPKAESIGESDSD